MSTSSATHALICFLHIVFILLVGRVVLTASGTNHGQCRICEIMSPLSIAIGTDHLNHMYNIIVFIRAVFCINFTCTCLQVVIE